VLPYKIFQTGSVNASVPDGMVLIFTSAQFLKSLEDFENSSFSLITHMQLIT